MCILSQLALCWAVWQAFLSLVPPSQANELVLVDRGSDLNTILVRGSWVTRTGRMTTVIAWHLETDGLNWFGKRYLGPRKT